ncbi:MAG: interleukin-like EMT inducer domain-containing protein [Anaerolineae bacterium]|nr:interleukin-like EMT inducer domain-containing protein [Anaerolineae bacterium]
MTRTRFWRVLALFLVLSLGLTWPLLPHVLTHVPGDGIDDPALAWNLWWARHSWVDRAGANGLAHSPFDGDSMFYPVGINLAFYTLTLLNAALSIPLQLAGSVILASNLLLLGSFVVGGLGAYLLALSLLVGMERPGGEADRRRLRAAALLAGLLYAFASAKLFYAALGQFNIASSQWLPFVALYLVRAARGPWRPRRWGGLGRVLFLQTRAEQTKGRFAVLLIALTVGVVIGAAVAGRAMARFRPWAAALAAPARRLLTAAVMAALLFLLGLAPYLRAMAPDLAAEGDFLVEGSGFAEIFSADLVGFFFPTQLHPLFGGIIRRIADDSAIRPDRSQFQVNKGQHLFLGYTAVALAAVGLWRRRNRRELWLIAGLSVFFLLAALGPRLRWNGYDTGIPGLFPLLLKIPFFQANRYPSRYSVLILLGLAVLVAVGAAVALGRVRSGRRGAVTVLLAGLLLFEHLSIPLPLSDLRLPPAYRAVLADPRPGALLDLPLGWRNGFNVFGKSDVIIMFIQWYQTYHGRPLLSGNTSRNPEHKFQYFLENPVLGVLAALQDDRPVTAADWERAQALAPDLLRFLNVHTVLVHRERVPATFPDHLATLLPITPVEEQGDIVRYEVRLPPERATAAIAAADPELRGYLAQGWGVPVADGESLVWATRPQAHLLLPGLSRSATFRLRLYVPGEQTLRLVLDGREIARHVLPLGEHEVLVPVPASANGFPHRLVLAATRAFDPATLRRGGRSIGATGVTSPVHVTVRSAGKDIGDFGHVFVNGVDYSPNRRGYNLVAIAPTDGAVLAAAHFDTHDPFVSGPSAALAAWIEALPDGVIVAGAVRDAAALNLGEDAVQALRRLGVVGDIRGHLRRAHAFIGVKGAAAGTAAEVTSDLWPATVAVGDGLTEPRPTLALLGLGWETNGWR